MRVRGEQGGRLASMYAAVPAVRSRLIEYQRSRRQDPGLVADGRDMGTVVFPDATLKDLSDCQSRNSSAKAL